MIPFIFLSLTFDFLFKILDINTYIQKYITFLCVHVCVSEISSLPLRNKQILGQEMPRSIFVTKEADEQGDGEITSA
jgi:hypothetical protein